MTITLSFSDKQVRYLKTRAAQHGQSVEEYLLNLAKREVFSDEEWEALADELTGLIPDTVPALPDEALRRETMYRE
ncbi:MAG TPA: hypothetical protein VKP65_08790 [Rhodothermales bacterium]|nr:hypothetical protein [Rhodothermales bacterium]